MRYAPAVPPRMRAGARRVAAARGLAALACAAVLAGCGGGIFLGFEIGDSDDRPPNVALSSAVSEADPLAIVRLAAAASDDFGVDAVSFYREETAGPPTLLATVTLPPYQLDTQIPASAAGTVWRYFARAFDSSGQHTDSERVAITVR